MGDWKSEKLTSELIATALKRAGTHARSKGYTWNGTSCFYVSGLALGLVMDTRNGKKIWVGGQKFKGDGSPVLEVEDPKCQELACADHYFQTRMVAGITGPAGYVTDAVDTEGYDALKTVIFWLKDMRTDVPSLVSQGGPWNVTALLPDSMRIGLFLRGLVCNSLAGVGDRWEMSMRENPGHQVSRPNELVRTWAMKGNSAGLTDYALNPVQIVNLVRVMGK